MGEPKLLGYDEVMMINRGKQELKKFIKYCYVNNYCIFHIDSTCITEEEALNMVERYWRERND